MSRSWLVVGFKYPNMKLLEYYLIDLTLTKENITVNVYRFFLYGIYKKLTRKVINHLRKRGPKDKNRLLYVTGYSNKQIDVDLIIENLRKNGRLICKYYI
jgi:hypothetical protein